MRAAPITSFGAPEVLGLVDLPEPAPGPGQVAIDVACAGVSYAEVLFRRGLVPVELPFVPGIEVAGRVRSVGEGVAGLRPGALVAGLTIVDGGGYGEVAVADASLVAPITDAFDLARAAATPANTTTACLVFRAVARLTRGESVLVHGAAGGVGSQLGQVARALGAGLVVGTVGSPEKVEFAKQLGYDAVLVRPGFEQAVRELTDGRGVDVVVDPVGGELRRRSLEALAPLGRLVVIGNASGDDDVAQSLNELWLAGRAILGFNLRDLAVTDPGVVHEALVEALALVSWDAVHVETTELPLEEAAAAHRLLESGRTVGKLVLRVADGPHTARERDAGRAPLPLATSR